MKRIQGKALSVIGGIVLALTINIPTLAQSSSASSAVTQIPAPNVEVRQFAHLLCNKISSANRDGKDIPEAISQSFADYLGIKTTDADYQEKVTAFWNAHHADMLCRGKYNDNCREQEHITKRMVNTGMTDQFFSKFLFRAKFFNLETIEYIEDDINQPETLVEFLTKIIDDPAKQNRFSIDKLKRLRDRIKLFIRKRHETLEAQLQSQQH
ncbi:MAG: hypothetical protein NWQ54_21595 [Paraglaciecola sp.]|nr:hypothetical protein [Paraglaciecola sp.]